MPNRTSMLAASLGLSLAGLVMEKLFFSGSGPQAASAALNTVLGTMREQGESPTAETALDILNAEHNSPRIDELLSRLAETTDPDVDASHDAFDLSLMFADPKPGSDALQPDEPSEDKRVAVAASLKLTGTAEWNGVWQATIAGRTMRTGDHLEDSLGGLVLTGITRESVTLEGLGHRVILSMSENPIVQVLAQSH